MSLQFIQTKLNAPKDQYNSFGKYNYRSLEGILKAVKPLLEEFKYSLVISDKMIEVGGRVYVEATATLKGDNGEIVAQNTACAREAETKKGMDDSQITGSTSSYARKYCLNGLFAIDDTKDADATNTHGKENVSTNQEPWKNQEQQELYGNWTSEADQNGQTIETLGAWYTTNSARAKKELDEHFYNKFNAYVADLKKALLA